MVRAVQDAIPLSGDDTTGYKEEDVGSHSLRSGGATALYINGYDTMAIQRAGRWTSDTFLMYIHSQLDVVLRGLLEAMATRTHFLNMVK